MFFRQILSPKIEEVHYSLHVFFDIYNEICTVNIEELLNKVLESLQFCIETRLTKNFTCGSETNVNVNVTLEKSYSKLYGIESWGRNVTLFNLIINRNWFCE